MQVSPFRIEQYYARHEFTAAYMLSSSDAESVAVADLLALEPGAEERLQDMRLGYTESPGSPSLRRAIAALYGTAGPEDVVVVSAAEEGIFTAYHALLRPGDHVVVETPCYESALELARSAGVEVTEWRRSYADGWAHDLQAFERALRPDLASSTSTPLTTRPGTLMPLPVLEGVVELVAERGAWLFCDEVYRELEHDPADRLPAAVDLYERAISLGSMSKTYGLPGLRLGWLASHDRQALDRVLDFKHYTTICSSAPSELLGEIALRHREALVERTAPSSSETCAPRRVPRPAPPDRLVGAAERSPIGFARMRAWGTSWPTASGSSPRPVCCCYPGRCTTSQRTCGSASAGRTCPRRSPASGPGSTGNDWPRSRIQAPPSASSTVNAPLVLPQPNRVDSTHRADTPLHGNRARGERRRSGDDEAKRLTTSIDRHRFATHTLQLPHAESAAYATARYVEAEPRGLAGTESGMSGDLRDTSSSWDVDALSTAVGRAHAPLARRRLIARGYDGEERSSRLDDHGPAPATTLSHRCHSQPPSPS